MPTWEGTTTLMLHSTFQISMHLKTHSLVASCFDNLSLWEPNLRHLRSAPQTLSGGHKLDIPKREAPKRNFLKCTSLRFRLGTEREITIAESCVNFFIDQIHSSGLKKTLPALRKLIEHTGLVLSRRTHLFRVHISRHNAPGYCLFSERTLNCVFLKLVSLHISRGDTVLWETSCLITSVRPH